MAEKNGEKKDQDSETGEEVNLIFPIIVMIREEKWWQRVRQLNNWLKKEVNMIIAVVLIVIAIAAIAMSVNQYNQNQEKIISGSYSVNREWFNIPLGAGWIEARIDQDYALNLVINNASNGDLQVSMSLEPENYSISPPSDVIYKINSLTIRGKNSKLLPINERLLPKTNIVGVFNSSIKELGHTLSLEVEMKKVNTSTDYNSAFFYRVDMLRESSGRIYYIKVKDSSMKREPGFEAVLLLAVLVIVVAIKKRK